jgi:hypothetical protein
MTMTKNARRLTLAAALSFLLASGSASAAETISEFFKELADAGLSLTKRIGPGPGADDGAEFAYVDTNGSDSGSLEFALSYAPGKLFEDETSVWELSSFIAGNYTSGAKQDNNAFQAGVHAVGDLYWRSGTAEAADDFGLFVRIGPTLEWSADGKVQNAILDARASPFWPAIAANYPVSLGSAIEFVWEPTLITQFGENVEGHALAVEQEDVIFRVIPAAKLSLSFPGVRDFLGVNAVVVTAAHTHTYLPNEDKGNFGLSEYGVKIAITESFAIGVSRSDGERSPKFEDEEITKVSLQIKIAGK